MKHAELNLKSFRQVISVTCGGGTCPRILINENGDALVQGSLVDEAVKQELNVPDDENMVFVPQSIIQEFINQNK